MTSSSSVANLGQRICQLTHLLCRLSPGPSVLIRKIAQFTKDSQLTSFVPLILYFHQRFHRSRAGHLYRPEIHHFLPYQDLNDTVSYVFLQQGEARK